MKRMLALASAALIGVFVSALTAGAFALGGCADAADPTEGVDNIDPVADPATPPGEAPEAPGERATRPTAMATRKVAMALRTWLFGWICTGPPPSGAGLANPHWRKNTAKRISVHAQLRREPFG